MESPGKFTLWGLEVFVATAEDGAISAAARRLGASPSSVSQQLSNLETALGVQLLERSARPMRLTPAGALFRVRAQAILNEAEQARAELAGQDLTNLPRLRLGVIEDFDADITPGLLSLLAARMSKSRFLLETGATHRLIDQLEHRALDIVIAASLDSLGDWVEAHVLMEDPFVAVCPPGQAGRIGRDLPMIAYTERHVMGRQIAAHLSMNNLQASQQFELDSYHAILAMVAEGRGWSVLTPLAVARAQRFLRSVELHPLPLPPAGREIVLYARRDVLGSMPSDIAQEVRGLLETEVIGLLTTRWSWLSDKLRLR